MNTAPTPAMTLEDAYARVTAPGAPFETVEATVHGEVVSVFKNRPRNLRDYLERSVGFGDRKCWIFDNGFEMTYAEHARAVASIAASLRDRYGIGKGDRVAILGANSLEWILTFWATTALGGITSAMNGWWQGDEIAYGIELSQPKLLVVDEKRAQRMADLKIDVPLVVIERDFETCLWDTARDLPLPDQPIDEDDPAVIMFTSGTTGRPKGAVMTHRNFICFIMLGHCTGAARALQYPRPAGAPAPAPMTSICSCPLFHVSGMQSAAISGIANGAPYIWTTGRFDPKQILELTVKYKVPRLGGIPTQMWRVLEHPDIDKYDLSHVMSTGGGGSVLSPELQRVAREKLPNAGVNFNIGYGLTECAGLCTMAFGDMLAADPDSVGKAIPTAQVAIFDDDGAELPPGEVGNVCIRGPMVMPGYWQNEKATADAFFPGRWLKSGDFGWLRDDGTLFLATRKRDMIIRGGENIYPIEIENRLDEHPAIAEAAIVGVDHRTLGQQVKAIVVTRPGTTLTEQDVKDWVADSLAYYKVPEYVDIRTEALPRNASGKVMKHVLTGEAENTFVEE